MNATNYKRLLSQLPKRLTAKEVSQRLGIDYSKTLRLIKTHRYQATDGRSCAHSARRKIRPEEIDWKMSNAEIARLFSVSRERVRVLRNDHKQPFVESRGRRPACACGCYPHRREC